MTPHELFDLMKHSIASVEECDPNSSARLSHGRITDSVLIEIQEEWKLRIFSLMFKHGIDCRVPPKIVNKNNERNIIKITELSNYYLKFMISLPQLDVNGIHEIRDNFRFMRKIMRAMPESRAPMSMCICIFSVGDMSQSLDPCLEKLNKSKLIVDTGWKLFRSEWKAICTVSRPTTESLRSLWFWSLSAT